MAKQMNLSVSNLRIIHDLCRNLNIQPEIYDRIDNKLAGKLIMDLSNIAIFKAGDLKTGKINAPNPEDYMTGGKYDRR